MQTLVKNGTVINPAGEEGRLDILINDGRVAAIGQNSTLDFIDVDEVIDASGLIVAPGLVDCHVHFRDPGQTHKEDIFTGAEAAKRGGFTSVVMMANTNPPIDNVETLEYVLKRGHETGIHVYAVGTVTKGMEGRELSPMSELAAAGVVGFSDDGRPIENSRLAITAMIIAKQLNVPVSFHEEDPQYIESPGFNKGKASRALGVGGADRKAEWRLATRDLEFAFLNKAKIIIQHVSARETVELLRYAKSRPGGHLIHAEATPHHFALTEDDAALHGTFAKMNPPLRTEEDRRAIIEGLRDGTIDIIATDHAPHSLEDKQQGLDKAPSGVIGLETSLGVGITELVREGHLTLSQLIERMTVGPARAYNLNAGVIRIGCPADIVIFDPDEEWRVEMSRFSSKSCNSPFIGNKLYGKVKYTICDGEIVCR